jgi:hypothetical protein
MADIKAKKVLFKNRDGESLIPYIGEDYVKQEDMVEINLGLTLTLFDTILKDHILTYQESQGLALQGTYVYKEALAGSRYGYPDFYAKCLEEFKQATTTETVNGVMVKVHSNGHKFYDIADKNSIDLFYNATGTAWFYGIDAVGERIFLPRNNYFEQATGDVSEVGKSIEAGLPNIDGSVTIEAGAFFANSPNGCFALFSGSSQEDPGGGGWGASTAHFDASQSNPIYGNSNTVQPNAVKKLLYICVGNTTNYEGVSDVVNQGMDILEQVNQGIESRVAKDSMQEVPCIVETYVNGTSWYRVWSDGFKEQGGHAPNGNNAEYVLNFLIPFSNTDYKIFKCNNWLLTSNVPWQFLNFWNKTTTTATTHNANQTNGGSGFDWYACGY